MAQVRTRAHDFFDTHVVPSVEEWRKNPTDLRLAMNAAVALNQMADHFWHAYSAAEPHRVFGSKTVGAFRDALATQRPAFGLLRDVAEAHKHVKLNRHLRAITSAGQTVVGSLGYGEAEYGVGLYGGGPEVVVSLDTGERRHFSALVEETMQMWGILLK